MCVLVNCQTSVKLFSLLIARFMVFLLLSLVDFFFPMCSWSVLKRCGWSTLPICKYLRICLVITAAFSQLRPADSKGFYFTMIILSHLIQLPWPMYQRLYRNVAVLQLNFGVTLPLTEISCLPQRSSFSGHFCALSFILWIWNTLFWCARLIAYCFLAW